MKEAHKSCTPKSVEQARIEAFLQAKQSSPDTTSPAQKRQHRNVVSPTPGDSVRAPVPVNGTQYTKLEALAHLTKTRKNSKERADLMRAMVNSSYAPTIPRFLQKLLKKHEDGELIINNAWSGVGRKRLMPDSAICDFVDNMKLGQAHGERDIQSAIRDYQQLVLIRI